MVLAGLTALPAACGGSTAPTPNTPNLGGNWSGVLGAGSGGGRALRITWTVTQNATQPSGLVTVSTSPAVNPIVFAGTLSAVANGSQMTMTLAARMGSSDCVVNGTGIANVNGGAIDGTLDVTFSACDGLDVQPPSGDHLTLTKQ